jgi:hypothetical protein
MSFERGSAVKKCTVLLLLGIIFPFAHNTMSDPRQLQDQLWLLETYEHADARAVADNVSIDLQSDDAQVQDAGCIILLKTIERIKKGDGKSDSIFSRLAGDQKAVRGAADIIDSRLLGWYNPQESQENEDDIQIYAPLFYILGKADNKTARGILVKSFLYLRGHPDILALVPMSEALASVSLKRLELLQSKLCCAYPGKDIIADMLEKDSRYSMLEMFENYLKTNKALSEKLKEEIQEFAGDCLKYGDSKNGYLIRAKAAAVAGLLAKAGDHDLVGKIQETAKNDPFYVHACLGKAGYSLKELHYPVREICEKILANLKR